MLHLGGTTTRSIHAAPPPAVSATTRAEAICQSPWWAIPLSNGASANVKCCGRSAMAAAAYRGDERPERQPRVVETGAAGMVGSAIVRTLLALGADVRAHAGPPGTDLAALRVGLPVSFAEITDAEAVGRIVAEAEAVVHLAGPASVAESFSAPALYVRAHVAGIAAVIEACRASDARRLVHISSAEVYGQPRANPVAKRARPRSRGRPTAPPRSWVRRRSRGRTALPPASPRSCCDRSAASTGRAHRNARWSVASRAPPWPRARYGWQPCAPSATTSTSTMSRRRWRPRWRTCAQPTLRRTCLCSTWEAAWAPGSTRWRS